MYLLLSNFEKFNNFPWFYLLNFPSTLYIAASGNILASGNLCFRVFKLQLKVINKNVCYLCSVRVNQIN